MWGGTTPNERLNSVLPAKPYSRKLGPATCGTDSGYYKHIREHTTRCDECKSAHAEAESKRNARHSEWRLGRKAVA
jgi:hypothetical protein